MQRMFIFMRLSLKKRYNDVRRGQHVYLPNTCQSNNWPRQQTICLCVSLCDVLPRIMSRQPRGDNDRTLGCIFVWRPTPYTECEGCGVGGVGVGVGGHDKAW